MNTSRTKVRHNTSVVNIARGIKVDSAYWRNGHATAVADSDIIATLADTGWYDRNNADSDGTKDGDHRIRYVRTKNSRDPVYIVDGVAKTIPGGFLRLDGSGIEPAKDTTPYLHHFKRAGSTMSAWHELIEDIMGKKQNDKLHPRFTAVKNVLRTLHAIEEKRSKAYTKVRKEIDERMQYPY